MLRSSSLLILLCSLLVISALDLQPRLIQFNESYAAWYLPQDIDKLAEECTSHGGFFDITDHRSFGPEGLKVSIVSAFPAKPTHQIFVNKVIPALSTKSLADNNNVLSSFYTRYYTTQTGKDAATFIRNQFLAYAKSRSDVKVSFFEHTWLQPSVIARVEGKTFPDEIVIIGAHEDSINNGANGRAPGADDDASGTVTVLEIFKVLMEAGWTPARSVEFQTYAAEEVGLRGSQDIAAKYQKDGKKVYAMLQLDMTFYRGSQSVPSVGIITDYVNQGLTAFLRQVVGTYSNLPWTDTKCGYACSDHASWDKAGYAASIPAEAPFPYTNKKLHTSSDTLDVLDLLHGLEFAKIGLGFVVELAGVVDAL